MDSQDASLNLSDGTQESPSRRRSRQALGGFLLTMAALHVVAAKQFESIIPEALGAPRFWNLLATAFEAVSGGLLLTSDPKKRRVGAGLAAATMVAVFPANINMVLQDGRELTPKAVALWLRLPIQIPLIRWAMSHARAGRT